MKYTCSCRRRHAAAGDTCGERRQWLGLAALAAFGSLGALAGCGERAGEAQSLAPVEIDRSTSCELDGMLLSDYPGPKGQIRFANVAEVQWFCDTTELLSTLLAPEQVRTVVSAG